MFIIVSIIFNHEKKFGINCCKTHQTVSFFLLIVENFGKCALNGSVHYMIKYITSFITSTTFFHQFFFLNPHQVHFQYTYPSFLSIKSTIFSCQSFFLSIRFSTTFSYLSFLLINILIIKFSYLSFFPTN